jgi:hypothetical protein
MYPGSGSKEIVTYPCGVIVVILRLALAGEGLQKRSPRQSGTAM